MFISESSTTEVAVTVVLIAGLSPAILILLLATRLVAIGVRSRNNELSIWYSPKDRGVSEATIDAFFRRVHSEREHVRASTGTPVGPLAGFDRRPVPDRR